MGETKTFLGSIVSAKYSRLIGVGAAAVLFEISALVLAPVCKSQDNTFAAPTPSTTTLSMTTPSVSLSLALSDAAGTFAVSDPASFSVTTNNYTGYALSIRAKEDNANNSKLINGSHVLNSISAATADGTGFSVGDWGYKPSKLNSVDNTNFLPAPTYAGSVLNTTATANSTADNYSLALAAKADVNTISGTYSNTFVLAAVPNAVNYTIAYNKNTTDTVSNMPSTQSGELSSSDITISATAPTRTDAIFLGWCNGATTQVVDITTDDSCNGTTYAAGATYPTSMQTANTAELKAMWRVLPPAGTFNRAYYDAGKTTVTVSGTKYYQMQEMNAAICTAVTTGNTGQLVDNRDSQIYDIGKLLDGNCWMINTPLLLNLVTYKNVLSSSNTNATDVALNYLRNGGGSTPYAQVGLNTSSDNYYYPYSVGYQHDLCAASAGAWCQGTNTVIQSVGLPWQDVCSKGWRMTSKDEYINLHDQYIATGSGTPPVTSGIYPSTSYGIGVSWYVCTRNSSGGAGCRPVNRGYRVPIVCLAK